MGANQAKETLYASPSDYCAIGEPLDTNIHSDLTYQGNLGLCYANAATSAYINTCQRIYGCNVPDVKEALEVASYNKENGGDIVHAINLLERRYKKGIQCRENIVPTIRDIMASSIVIVFSTSDAGWRALANGELLDKAKGEASNWHACLIEKYDLDKDCSNINNVWGDSKSPSKTCLRFSALHQASFVQVYFTVEPLKMSLSETPLYKSVLSAPFVVTSGDFAGMTCWHMDEDTARYESDLYTIPRPSNELDHAGVWTHIGVDLNAFIDRKLKRHAKYVPYTVSI